MPHLTRVDLSKNKLNSKLISFLIKHQHLESANLNTTNLTIESLKNLLEQSNLKRVYILDTKVTEEDLFSLKETYADIDLISGFKFKAVVEPKSVFNQEKIDR